MTYTGNAGGGIACSITSSVDDLLASGGDSRLQLDPVTGLNVYGCAPRPRPEAVSFASSTASSVSAPGATAAAAALRDLQDAHRQGRLAPVFEEAVGAQRRTLLELLALADDAVDVVFAPSGTDAQLHALVLSRALMKGTLVTVIAAADETGSGTIYTASGQHFNAITANGEMVTKGAAVLGLSGVATPIRIPVQTADGAPRPSAEADVAVTQKVAAAVAAGHSVLLQVMDCSKLGRQSPSLECVQCIAARFGRSVQILIDACQVRLSRSRLRWYLTQGYMVLVTGSKFFAGPPFSGALLVPAGIHQGIKQLEGLPAGLRDYTTSHDWPPGWEGLRRSLPDAPNLGQFLRWTAALAEMKAYYAVPAASRRAIHAALAAAVPSMIAATPGCAPLTDPDTDGIRTIFPFFLERNGDTLPFESCGVAYRALNRDLSSIVSSGTALGEGSLAGRICHIGQPVAVGGQGVLRISISARTVVEVARVRAPTDTAVREQTAQIRLVLDKLSLILRHWDAVAGLV